MNDTSRITILVVDDHPLMRYGIVSMLRIQPDMSVIGEAGTAREALSMHRKLKPDVTVLDLVLPDGTGIDAIQAVRWVAPEARFVMLTNSEGDEDIHQALSAGAQGYIVKGMQNNVLIDAVRKVHRGGRFLPNPLANTLHSRNPDSDLSPREREVLALVVKGQSNKQIGRELGICEATVKRHMGAILTRMEVTDRTQVVIAALRRGLARL